MSRRKQIEEMLKDQPDDSFLNYALAKEHASEGNVDAALQQYSLVIDNFPNEVAAYFQKGQLLAEEDRTDDAREVIEQGMKVARQVGDQHALGEMQGFLELL